METNVTWVTSPVIEPKVQCTYQVTRFVSHLICWWGFAFIRLIIQPPPHLSLLPSSLWNLIYKVNQVLCCQPWWFR